MAIILVHPLADGVIKNVQTVFNSANDTFEAAETLTSLPRRPRLDARVLNRINFNSATKKLRSAAGNILRAKLAGLHTGSQLYCCVQPLAVSDQEKSITVTYNDEHMQKLEYHGFVNTSTSDTQSVVIESREGTSTKIRVAAKSMVVWSCKDKKTISMRSQLSASRVYLRWKVIQTAPEHLCFKNNDVLSPGDVAAGLEHICTDPHLPILL